MLLAQAVRVRKQALILPEPPGDRRGETGSGPLLRLLIVGDSAAAGVGANSQDQALLGQLVIALGESFTVRWQLEARSGATSLSALSDLKSTPACEFDVVTTSLGVNDITSGARLDGWLRRQAELRDVLRLRFGVRLLVVAGLPPMHLFPGLPQPLRWHIGLRARQFDAALEQDINTEPDCAYVSLNVSDDSSAMAADGFHPGPPIYTLWASLVADQVRKHFAPYTLNH